MLDHRIVSNQPAGFGEFGGGAFGVAFERVGGGEPCMRSRMNGIGVTRLFEPRDRLVGARLQQVDCANSLIPNTDQRITGAKAEGLLLAIFLRP